MPEFTVTGGNVFLPTPSARRATKFGSDICVLSFISTHALREEGDPSCRKMNGTYWRNFYPRPPRGGRRNVVPRNVEDNVISTHALREEGGFKIIDQPQYYFKISTHALREEGDHPDAVGVRERLVFLPTPSARRATLRSWKLDSDKSDFYPRPPRGGRRGIKKHGFSLLVNFYPRPPRGGRRRSLDFRRVTGVFLPTPSARRATSRCGCVRCPAQCISTHALREEGDT